MKNVDSSLLEHIRCVDGAASSVAVCLKVSCVDGHVICLTNADRDIEIENMIYSSSPGVNMEKAEHSSDIECGDSECSSVIDSELITESDIMSGRYDKASLQAFLINRDDPSMGKITLMRGFFGDVIRKGDKFSVSIKSLISELEKKSYQLFGPLCRVSFCDSCCGLKEEDYTFEGIIESLDGPAEYTVTINNLDNNDPYYFNRGTIKFNTGQNIGVSMEIADYYNGKLVLNGVMPFLVAMKDTFSITAGCDKLLTTCSSKFHNAINFRGEPHLPGVNFVMGGGA